MCLMESRSHANVLPLSGRSPSPWHALPDCPPLLHRPPSRFRSARTFPFHSPSEWPNLEGGGWATSSARSAVVVRNMSKETRQGLSLCAKLLSRQISRRDRGRFAVRSERGPYGWRLGW